jgi:hypothetical protein
MGSDEPHSVSPQPPPHLYSAARLGPRVMCVARCPQSGRESGSGSVVGPSRVEINLTFSPLDLTL